MISGDDDDKIQPAKDDGKDRTRIDPGRERRDGVITPPRTDPDRQNRDKKVPPKTGVRR
jgi:hypothetical protein